MHRRNRQTVAGHADETDKPLLPRLDGRLERAAFPKRELPLDRVHQIVKLEQIDPVDAEPVERAMDLGLRRRVLPLPGLRRDEETARVPREPGRDPQL